jgi:hypothetical protein
MPVEPRGQAIRVMINLVNRKREEPAGCGGGRQPSLNGTSRVTGDCHARICERLGVKIPGATRRRPAMVVPTATVETRARNVRVRARWEGGIESNDLPISI